ncbi:hypothetical protein B0H19DRAFT_1247862 [Mycena capillaripes]|nr:hypothetical protein B0H19DRAFT_1247862 [Mycena capillaripes]
MDPQGIGIVRPNGQTFLFVLVLVLVRYAFATLCISATHTLDPKQTPPNLAASQLNNSRRLRRYHPTTFPRLLELCN